jgi:hypothetical protein
MSSIKLFELRKQLTENDLRNIALARTALAAASIALLDISVAHAHSDDVSAQTSALRRSVRAVSHQLDLVAADVYEDDAQRSLIASCRRVLDAH